MLKTINKVFTSQNSIKSLLVQFFLLCVFVSGTAMLMHGTWVKNLNLYHTILELACVFIALSIFISVWYTYYCNTSINFILGFGFLAVAVLDVFHIYYHLKLDLTARTYFDLSTRFWILGRLTEAIVLFLSIHFANVVIKRWKGLLITVTFIAGISYLVIAHHGLLPLLLTSEGVTPIKVALEYVVICIYLVSLYSLKDKLQDNAILTYKYIFISLLMSSISEISFTLYTSIDSISWTVGHLLKLISYFYLFKGIFISAIVYPYEKLAESDNYKTELLNKIPIAINNYDSNCRLIFSNKKAAEIMGYSFDELKGLTADEVSALLHRYEKESIEKYCCAENAPSKPIIKEIRTITDKSGKQIRINLDVHRLDNGELMYLFNDAKRDQELEHLQLQTQTILNSLDSMVVIYDREHKLIMCNKAFEKLTGLRQKEITGLKMDELYKILKFIKKPLQENSIEVKSLCSSQCEASFVAMNGTVIELMYQSSPVYNLDGEIVGNIDIFADISVLKKEQQKIIQQEKMAVLGQMSAAILHETKNFLATIKSSSQLLNVIAQDEKVKMYAQKIDKATNEVNNIVNNFLSLGKPAVKAISENSLNELVIMIKGILESSALVNRVDFETKLCSNSKILCDKNQIKLVILNICKNAIEAMSETENPKLIVETGEDDFLDEVFIKITDNGKGISPEEISRLGTPFFTTKEYGTGLGLNICYQILKEHGGKINVESKVGQGTTFLITFPRKCAEVAETFGQSYFMNEVAVNSYIM